MMTGFEASTNLIECGVVDLVGSSNVPDEMVVSFGMVGGLSVVLLAIEDVEVVELVADVAGALTLLFEDSVSVFDSVPELLLVEFGCSSSGSSVSVSIWRSFSDCGVSGLISSNSSAPRLWTALSISSASSSGMGVSSTTGSVDSSSITGSGL